MRTIIPKNASLVPERAVCVFKGVLFDTYQWEETMFDGSKMTFEMLKRPDSVEVLLVNDNKLLIQKQEQPHVGSFYSFPGGRHDHPNETEVEAAARELREESGYTCADWRLIKVMQFGYKIESFLYIFVAHTITASEALSLDAGERIENVWMTLPEVKQLMVRGEMRASAEKFIEELSEANDILAIPGYEA